MEGDDACNLLILLKLEEVLHVGTLGSLAAFRDFEGLDVVSLTLVCNKGDVIMAGADEEVVDVVAICKLGSDGSLATLSNGLVFRS